MIITMDFAMAHSYTDSASLIDKKEVKGKKPLVRESQLLMQKNLPTFIPSYIHSLFSKKGKGSRGEFNYMYSNISMAQKTVKCN